MAVSDKIGSIILYIVRHAEIKKDAEGKMRGLLNDPLDAKGEKQAQQLADLFRDRYVSAVYSDDLKRTKQTLEPIAAAKDLVINIDCDLRSWDVGALEGKSIEANKDKIKAFKSQPDTIPVGGQSWRDYIEQVRRFFSRYWTMGLESGPLMLVLHGSGIQLIWQMLGAMEASAEYDQTPLEPAGVAAIYLGREGPVVKVIRGGKRYRDE